jgi:hypothetical protein
MAILEISARRLIITGGFALAVAAAPAVAAFAGPSAGPVAQPSCPAGEESDMYTGMCVPHTVPNSPTKPAAPASPFGSIPGNPDVPEIDGIPCTGNNSGQCIGLAEDAPQYVPPTSSVGSSPTVHGHS